MNSSFKEKVLAVVRTIPRGQTRTYSEIARAVGHPGAARAVGTLMKHNYDPTVPCHRVLRADGKIGDYNRGGPEAKQKLLQEEGAIS